MGQDIINIAGLIQELSKYPPEMEVYYATKYALVPCTVKKLDDRCVTIDMAEMEKDKYKDWRDK